MNAAAETTQVLIAGGGPVGLTLGMDLARRGVAAIVVEARRDIPPNPRCNTTNARTMEILRTLGCAEAVRGAGLPPEHNTDVAYMTTLTGDEILRFERATPAEIARGEARGIGADWPTPEPQHFISQLYLEPVLREHAVESLGVDLRLGWALTQFTQDDDGVTAEIRDETTGETRSVRAAYLVGADGGASLVRRDIGARLKGVPKLRDACSVFLDAPSLGANPRVAPGWMYRLMNGVVVVAINGANEWLFHTHPKPGVDIAEFDPRPDIFAAVGEPFDYKVINVTRWTARAMVADKFREGRVLLAGDAAHIWIPMGGFGMNAGVGDAFSLGWRLAGVLQGWLAPQHLDSYEAERAPMGERVAKLAARWAADIGPLSNPDSVLRQALNTQPEARKAHGDRIREVNTSEWESVGLMLGYAYEGSPVIVADGPPPPFELSRYQESSVPGVRAPHVWRDATGEGRDRRALFDDFGPGFTLLRIGRTPPAGEALAQAARLRGAPLAIVEVPEAEAVEKYENYGLVLVRPDQHIAWRSHSEPTDAEAQAVFDVITGARMPVRGVRVLEARPADAPPNPMPEPVREAETDASRRILADAVGRRLMQVRVGPDAVRSEPRPFVQLASEDAGGGAAGLCADGAGGIWACLPAAGRVNRYDDAGRLTIRVLTPGAEPTACDVAPDGRTLNIAGRASTLSERPGPAEWRGSVALDGVI